MSRRFWQVICLDVVSLVLCFGSLRIARLNELDGRWPDNLNMVVWFIGAMAWVYAMLLWKTNVDFKTVLIVSALLSVEFCGPVDIWSVIDDQIVMTQSTIIFGDGVRVIAVEVSHRLIPESYESCRFVGKLFLLGVLLGHWCQLYGCRLKRRIGLITRHAKQGVGSICCVS